MASDQRGLRALYRPLILRAFPEVGERKKRGEKSTGWTRYVLLLDTETTTDPTQRLLFGSYQFAKWEREGLRTLEEGLFYGDDLPEHDPEAFRVLQVHARAEGLTFLSRREFVNDRFWKAAHQLRATVVGFNLPFDLSRLAVSWRKARGKDRGGFSFVLWDYWDEEQECWRENKYRPRLVVKHLDPRRSFIRFKGARDMPKRKRTRGFFLDLRTLVFALTSKSHSLRSACEAFGVGEGKGQAESHGRITPEYIEYNRQDVRATRALGEKLRREFDRYPIELDPCKAYSPASISKACLDAMGLGSPHERFKDIPGEVHGRAMGAYYGGRAEAGIRRALVPVVVVDFLSMYPTVNTCMDTWRYLTAADLHVVDCSGEVRGLLDRIELDDCFDPDAWKDFVFLAEIEPDGDILPVRAHYDGQNRNTGVNELAESPVPVWYSGPDLIASKLLAGRAPKVLRAIALRAEGKSADLRTIDFGYGIRIDPTDEDFFQRLIELRKSLRQHGVSETDAKRLSGAFKTIANSGPMALSLR